MLQKERVNEILESNDFSLESTSGFGESYRHSLGNGWEIAAYCSFEGNPFAGNVNTESYEEVDIHLFDMIGTSHICKSEKSLEKNLSKIVGILLDNSNNEEILKCPKCKERYVSPKTPHEGQKWKPFLSCKGMQIVGQGRNKTVLCNGTSKKLPAVVNY